MAVIIGLTRLNEEHTAALRRALEIRREDLDSVIKRLDKSQLSTAEAVAEQQMCYEISQLLRPDKQTDAVAEFYTGTNREQQEEFTGWADEPGARQAVVDALEEQKEDPFGEGAEEEFPFSEDEDEGGEEDRSDLVELTYAGSGEGDELAPVDYEIVDEPEGMVVTDPDAVPEEAGDEYAEPDEGDQDGLRFYVVPHPKTGVWQVRDREDGDKVRSTANVKGFALLRRDSLNRTEPSRAAIPPIDPHSVCDECFADLVDGACPDPNCPRSATPAAV